MQASVPKDQDRRKNGHQAHTDLPKVGHECEKVSKLQRWGQQLIQTLEKRHESPSTFVVDLGANEDFPRPDRGCPQERK
jgi:hypothetical protein